MGSKQAQDGANSETVSVLVAPDLDGTNALEKLGPFNTELNTHTHTWSKSQRCYWRIQRKTGQLEAWLMPHTSRVTQQINNNVFAK